MLQNGYTIKSIKGKQIRIVEYIAEGGQGEVYKVDYNGELKALKWYKKSKEGLGDNPQAFYGNLKSNINKGAPSKEFLWPIDMTGWIDGTFGYVMDLRPKGYFEMSDFMLTLVRFKSFKVAIDAALHIVSAYRILHNNGYSYQDLNDGNFFINPDNGNVLICDNDNVAPEGTDTGILGKPRYMAPEIVLRKSMPNSLSDRFSMSVIIFILLCLTHPLEGKRSLIEAMPPEIQEKLYGSEAMFILDPTDDGNRPHPLIHKNMKIIWPELPDYVKKFFVDAFSQKALKEPNSRPKELDWIKCLVRFRSEIVQCKCGNEVFTQGGKGRNCEKCNSPLNIPFRLEFSDYSMPGVSGSRIYRCQVGTCNADDALKPIGAVIANKNNPNLVAIANMSDKSWNALTPSGNAKRVAPKEYVPLKDGITFTANNANITIKENK